MRKAIASVLGLVLGVTAGCTGTIDTSLVVSDSMRRACSPATDEQIAGLVSVAQTRFFLGAEAGEAAQAAYDACPDSMCGTSSGGFWTSTCGWCANTITEAVYGG